MLYMLDTNICIHLMQRQPPEVVKRFGQLNEGDIVMSSDFKDYPGLLVENWVNQNP